MDRTPINYLNDSMALSKNNIPEPRFGVVCQPHNHRSASAIYIDGVQVFAAKVLSPLGASVQPQAMDRYAGCVLVGDSEVLASKLRQ